MKVIGAGLPRTATTTQMIAFEMLGLGPCYHMRDLMADLDGQLGYWESAIDGNGSWEAVFDGYQSVADWPGSYHWRELMDVYPDAKVLLSVRDASRGSARCATRSGRCTTPTRSCTTCPGPATTWIRCGAAGST